MRRAPLLATAAAAAIAAPLLLLLASARNRAAEPEAEVELSEHELPFVAVGEGRRWAILRLDWNRDHERDRKEAGWLDAAKLASLGFDVSVAAGDEETERFYEWQPPREVFLALELGGEEEAGPSARSRLRPVDADLDATALRARHPDRHRVLVQRGVVSAECRGRWDAATRTFSPRFLRGRINRLLVEELRLPREKRAHLDALASGTPPGKAGPHADEPARGAARAPRYTALLRTGRRLEPWIVEVRPAGPNSASP